MHAFEQIHRNNGGDIDVDNGGGVMQSSGFGIPDTIGPLAGGITGIGENALLGEFPNDDAFQEKRRGRKK